jgi:Xaa-Pro aminopeptidase
MKEARMDAALMLHPRDVLYYAGTARPASLLVVRGFSPSSLPQAAPQAILFVRRGLQHAQREATVERVEPMQGLSSIAEAVAQLGLGGGALGTEFDVVSAQLCRRVEEAFAGWELADVSPLVLDQRSVKDEDEIVAIRRAAAAADAGHEALPRTAVPGVSELELAAEVEKAMRLAGHEGYQALRHPGARGGGVLLMSGRNLRVRGGHGLVITGSGLSVGSPYGASRRLLRDGDLIVLDIGATCQAYTADESRTFVVGEPTPAQEALYAVVREAEEAVLGALQPGVPVDEVYAAAEEVVDRGAPPYFPAGSLVLPGFVGHGIGLELDEPPVLWPRDQSQLLDGMVLAVEIEVSVAGADTQHPGLGGAMIKLEDTAVVRSDGFEVLTAAPRELIGISQF